MAMRSNKQWFGAICASTLGAVALFAGSASAQTRIDAPNLELQGEGCPAREALTVTVTNTPGGAVTAFEITVGFNGMTADPATSGFQVNGADATRECSIALALSATGSREVKVNLRQAKFDVTSSNPDNQQLSVVSSARLGRAMARPLTLNVAATAAAGAAPLTSQLQGNLQATTDLMGGGGNLILNLKLGTTGPGAGSLKLNNAVFVGDSQADITG